MEEPVKPFACETMDCGMSFTNEDHLHVHRKKHEMVLQLGIEQKSAFVADQTPTPTRFIRNCEEVGLFQELQSVNPFDEGFKKAMEARGGIIASDSVIAAPCSDDVLHTPQMVFPNLTETSDTALYCTMNNQRNIIISRSSSDEGGVIKEYETTTISKCTNEVTISRVVGKPEVIDKMTVDDVAVVKNLQRNNVIKILNDVKVRTENSCNNKPVTKELTDPNKLQVPESNIPPIMSQKSLEFVVDSLTSDINNDNADRHKDTQLIETMKSNFNNTFNNRPTIIKNVKKTNKRIEPIVNKLKSNPSDDVKRRKLKTEIPDDCEVILKYASGKRVRMKAEIADDEEVPKQVETKEILRKVIEEKETKNPLLTNLLNTKNSVIKVVSGTLVPVTLIKSANSLPILLPKPSTQALPIPKIQISPISSENNSTDSNNEHRTFNSVKKKRSQPDKDKNYRSDQKQEASNGINNNIDAIDKAIELNRDVQRAASKRYRDKLKLKRAASTILVQELTTNNKKLAQENAMLKSLLISHMKKCPIADDIREIKKNINGISVDK